MVWLKLKVGIKLNKCYFLLQKRHNSKLYICWVIQVYNEETVVKCLPWWMQFWPRNLKTTLEVVYRAPFFIHKLDFYRIVPMLQFVFSLLENCVTFHFNNVDVSTNFRVTCFHLHFLSNNALRVIMLWTSIRSSKSILRAFKRGFVTVNLLLQTTSSGSCLTYSWSSGFWYLNLLSTIS